MGFLGKLANKVLRASVVKIGVSLGSTFANGVLGTGHKNGVNAIIIMNSAYKEDYAFIKDDILECTIMEMGQRYNYGGGIYSGNKYQVKFKDGKSALLVVFGQYLATFEGIVF